MTRDLQRALAAVETHGLLLMTDARLASVAGLIAGEPVRGSWWSHPKARAIYAVLVEMDRRPDLLSAKLVSGKVTFVHGRLWPAVLGVALARESWQTKPLSREARALLAEVDRRGEIPADGASGLAVRELENALLVCAEEFHSGTGEHRKRLRNWKAWARERNFSGKVLPPAQAKAALEQAVERLSAGFPGAGWLPWQRTAGTARGRVRHR